MIEFYAGNDATSGGAICLDGSSFGMIAQCTFTDNSAVELGGAIYARRPEVLNVFLMSTNEYFAANGAENGGALHGTEGFYGTILQCTFTDNAVKAYGGAVYTEKLEVLSIFLPNTNESFAGNKAESGGALCYYKNSYGAIFNCSFINHTVNYTGGAIYVESESVLYLTSMKFHQNRAQNAGALFLGITSTGFVSECNFTENIVTANGGAIAASSGSGIRLSDSFFSRNGAVQNGTIVAYSSYLSLESVALNSNNALFGGAIYGVLAIIEVMNSMLVMNHARRSGAGIYMEQSNATVKNTILLSNEATKNCGGICAYVASHLVASNLIVQSNIAGDAGGGIGVVNASSILCDSCKIMNNSAIRGGGLDVYSNNSIPIMAQLQNSLFENNSAHPYGGGIAFTTPSDKKINFHNANLICGYVLLLGTNFVGNIANLVGAAILTSDADGILIDCEYKKGAKQEFLSPRDFSSLKSLSPKQLCRGWINNRVLTLLHGGIVGTYGREVILSIDPDDEVRLRRNTRTQYVLENVSSGKKLPTMNIEIMDKFGVGPASTTPLSFEAQLFSHRVFIRGDYRASISYGSGHFLDVVGFARPGNYTLEINFKEVKFVTISVIVMVRKCRIGEELTLDRQACQKCDTMSYNFNPTQTRGCKQCPKDGNCTGPFIVPNAGYWHKSPCHATVRKCHVEEACDYENRLEALMNFTTNFNDCNISTTELEMYNDKLCNEGYKGSLCGSCKKSYGLSSSFECIKCTDIILSIFMIVAITCYLLFGTSISISGTLPLDSSQDHMQDEETPLVEASNPLLGDDASNSETRPQTQDDTQLAQSENTQAREDMEAIKRQLSEMWKVVLNFFQVISTAATMDIKWTSAILKLLNKLQTLGAASVESISVPIDCIVSSKSNAARIIWRTFFSVLTPILVIALLSLYWGVRYIYLHREERLYFIKRLILTIVTVTYITYFDLTQVAVRVFDCVSIHNNVDFNSNSTTRVWIVDTSIECYKGTHGVLIGIALGLLIFVSIGFPLFCSLILFLKRAEVYTLRSWAHETLSFLCGPFKEKFLYWECITMIKKALLSIAIVFSYSLGHQIQGLLILIILVLFLYIHFICYPYKEEFDILNYYESGSLLVCCLTYALVQFFNAERCSEFDRTMVSLAIFVVVGGFLCLVAYKIIRDLVNLLKAFLRFKGMTLLEFLKTCFKKPTPQTSNG
eukprot:g3687.t1